MILKIEASDAEARVELERLRGVMSDGLGCHGGHIEKLTNRQNDIQVLTEERLDLFRINLNNRGQEIKVLDGLMKNLQDHVARELTKVPAVVAKTENIQVNTDFAAQFAQQLNHNDQELANVAGNMRQVMHRLHLVEGQQNALALGVSTTSGKVLQTNVAAAGQDIRQLRLDYNKLEQQFIEMRGAISEALLTKPKGVKDEEEVQRRLILFESTRQEILARLLSSERAEIASNEKVAALEACIEKMDKSMTSFAEMLGREACAKTPKPRAPRKPAVKKSPKK